MDASDYGVARMLRIAGVDRVSLPTRAREIDEATRRRLEADFAAQRELVDALRRDAQGVALGVPAADLLLSDVDDELAGMFPVEPAQIGALRWAERAIPADHARSLETTRATHPASRVRTLAALGLAARGELRREVQHDLAHAVGVAGALGAVGAVLLCGWRSHHLRTAPRRLSEEHARALEHAAALPALAPWAAVARVLLGQERTAALEDELLAALGATDPELRLGAALALRAVGELGAFLHDGDEVRRAAARAELARVGAPSVAELLVPSEDRPLPPDEERAALLRNLTPPLLPGLGAAVMACFETSAGPLADQALQVLQWGRFGERSDAEQAALGSFALRNARRLGVERALSLLAWASERARGQGSVAFRPFVAAAAVALRSANERTGLAGMIHLDDFLANASDDEQVALDDLFAHEEAGAALLGRLLDVYARREDRGLPEEWIDAQLARAWARSPRPIAAIARALDRRSGMHGRERVMSFFWRRFCEHTEEQVDVVAATRPWNHLLREARDATPPTSRPGGEDPLALWQVWSHADAPEMWRLVEELKGMVADVKLARFADLVFEAAEAVLPGRPRTAVVTVFRVCAEIANRIRAQEQNEALDAAVAVMERRVGPFSVRFHAAEPCDDSESGAEHFLDDIATERRLIAEVHQRRRDEEARAAERHAAEQRAAEQRREADARRISARAAVEDAQTRSPPVASPVEIALPQPAFAPHSLDEEPFFPPPGPRSLLQYAQLLKAMQGGQDVMALMAAFGLEPLTWGPSLLRWNELMTRRPDLAMRLAELLGASWR